MSMIHISFSPFLMEKSRNLVFRTVTSQYLFLKQLCKRKKITLQTLLLVI